jgi:hypothetical protein
MSTSCCRGRGYNINDPQMLTYCYVPENRITGFLICKIIKSYGYEIVETEKKLDDNGKEYILFYTNIPYDLVVVDDDI